MIVFFEQETVNGSEGSVAVVCASAFFPQSSLGFSLLLIVDISVVDQGSAGI